jgi:hypothetical protein
MNPLLAQLTHRPFPEAAEILHNEADQITHEWDAAVRKAMPQMRNLTFDELKDSTPQIVLAISHALASDDPQVIRELVNRASVGMIWIVTRLLPLEITSHPRSFLDESSFSPKKSNASQMPERTSGARSPIPPEKTRVSNPPRVEVSAQRFVLAW